jgi:hypothetical protein
MKSRAGGEFKMDCAPAGGKWWLADLIVEFTTGDEAGKLVHYNLTLVRAESAERDWPISLVWRRRVLRLNSVGNNRPLTARG